MTDAEIGTKVLKSFWNWNRVLNGSTFNLSFDEFLKKLQPKTTKLNIILDGIGGGVREAGMSDSRIESAMRSLAVQSKGKIPSKIQDFFNFLISESTKVNFIDAGLYVVVESTKDVLKGAQAVGDSLITTGKILNFLLPAILLGAVFLWLNNKSGGQLIKVIKR